jgi:hypothetical protein
MLGDFYIDQIVASQVRTNIKIKNVHQVTFWCIKKVGPRLFHLHNKQGGQGWKIFRNGTDWYLELEDSRLLTMLILSIGDSL